MIISMSMFELFPKGSIGKLLKRQATALKYSIQLVERRTAGKEAVVQSISRKSQRKNTYMSEENIKHLPKPH